MKVNHGGVNVRARTGYCNVKQVDLLSGKPIEKELETMAAGTAAGTMKAAPMQVPFFYTSNNTARVYVAMDIPTASDQVRKDQGQTARRDQRSGDRLPGRMATSRPASAIR